MFFSGVSWALAVCSVMLAAVSGETTQDLPSAGNNKPAGCLGKTRNGAIYVCMFCVRTDNQASIVIQVLVDTHHNYSEQVCVEGDLWHTHLSGLLI